MIKQLKFDPRFGKVCISSIASLSAPLILILVAVVLGSVQPSYNPVQQTISALVLGPFGMLQTIAFYIFGLLIWIFAWRIYASVTGKSPALKIATALLLLVGVGFIIIGIFPTQGTGSILSLESAVHINTVKTMTVFVISACYLLAFSFKSDDYWRRMFIYTLVTAIIGTFMIVLGLIWALDSPWIGLYERIFLLNGLIWIEVVSLRLLTTCRAHFKNCCTLSLTRKTEPR